MILNHDELLLLIRDGVIDAPPENVGASSIDVRLGYDFYVEKVQPGWGLVLDAENIQCPLVKTLASDRGISLTPGGFLLACTMEKFNMPDDLSAEFRLRSSMARIGINHPLAAWIDPGFSGSNLTLELSNSLRRHSIILKPGVRIGQVIFHRHETVHPSASYRARGNYNNVVGVGVARCGTSSNTSYPLF